MWHRDFNEGAILIPDFESYPPWELAKHYGLDPDMVVTGFKTTFTAWSYADQNYRSAWGFGEYKPKKPFPELYFNIGIRRTPIGPFVINVLPILVIYLLTFGVILFMGKNDERSFNIIGAVSGLFFITLLNHQQIGSVAATPGFSLLGYGSMVMYISFFALVANAILLVKLDIGWLEWRDNFVVKLGYLPVTAFLFSLISLAIMV
jgi:hypothetical protein